MSTKDSIKRYHLIINRLRKSPATFSEIEEYLQNEASLRDVVFKFSLRTFKRDCDDIAEIYGIEINYDFSQKAYAIDTTFQDFDTQLFEAFDLIDTFGLNKHVSELILFEKRKSKGTEHLSVLLQSIKARTVIQLWYTKYYEHTGTLRNLEPYALKEFKSRWYVLAKDLKDNKLKTFALDRIENIIPTTSNFTIPQNVMLIDYFKNSFGIVCDETQEPQKIIISCTQFQGSYFKSLPLHHSQEILIDTEQEFQFSINVQITFDLIFELLSFGTNIKILSPDSVIEQLKNHYKTALLQYGN